MESTPFGIMSDVPVEVIIDGAHLFTVSRNLEVDIDYDGLRKLLFEEYDCRRITYVTKVLRDPDTGSISVAGIARLLDFLRYNGYHTIVGDAKEYNDPTSGRRSLRNNVDVAVACSMLRAARFVKEIIVFSGSEDLCIAADACGEMGARVTVVSTMTSISGDLRSTADRFIDLKQDAELLKKIIREKGAEAKLEGSSMIETRSYDGRVRERRNSFANSTN